MTGSPCPCGAQGTSQRRMIAVDRTAKLTLALAVLRGLQVPELVPVCQQPGIARKTR